jgi:hypothetical protein
MIWFSIIRDVPIYKILSFNGRFCASIDVIGKLITKILRSSSQSVWLLRNINISNDNGSYTFYVDVVFLLSLSILYGTWLYIWVTRRVSYKKQERLTLSGHLSSLFTSCFLVGSVLPIFYSFFFFVCCPRICFYVLNFVLWCPLRFSHKTMFCSFLPPVVCRSTHVLFTLFVFVFV